MPSPLERLKRATINHLHGDGIRGNTKPGRALGHIQPDGDEAVVDTDRPHVGAENAALHGGVGFAGQGEEMLEQGRSGSGGKLGREFRQSFHSHAAPRTPPESPWTLRSRRVSTRSENT